MLKHSLFISLLLLPFFSVGQTDICTGNLGENIFTSGDFGTGTANVLPGNPSIAPGYNYTAFPPPSDGAYTITNFTGAWPGLYNTWLRIPDNSPDPNGYMMVVNADYTPGLFYDQLVEGLCGNTQYEFSADVINLIKTPVTQHIKPNVSFLIDGVQFFTSGEIPQNEQWQTYGFTFYTEPGQTSVQLSLRNNAPGGVGNDLAIDNITFRPCGPEALILPTNIANICEDGDPIDLEATVVGSQYDDPAFQWQISTDEGLNWEDIPGANAAVFTHNNLSGGYYYYRYLLANGSANLQNSRCRVISNVKVVFVVPKFYEFRDTLCDGLIYQLGDETFTQSGIYQDSLLSSLGCDSIVTLDLTFVDDGLIEAETNVMDLSCFNTQDGAIELVTVFNGFSPLDIHLASLPTDSMVAFLNLPAGNYRLSITDRYGCSYQEILTVNTPPPFVVDVGPDLTVSLGDLVQLHAFVTTPYQSLSWNQLVDPLCVNDCLNPSWYPIESDTFSLTAVFGDSCITSDTLFIEVLKDRRVYFPNAFSPNDDGVNDRFMVYGHVPNVQAVNRLTIFNRWGGLVFDGTDLNPNDQSTGWDGTFLGKPAERGVYAYMAEVLFLDGQVARYSGSVSLLK
ncbi:MAG: hypothetical protein DHS20C18_26970 [Saprospiraceae bacterium]|nr:MAG: hypothetical protein DHS20C18_26970 [Saprospiraceae bacterium]